MSVSIREARFDPAPDWEPDVTSRRTGALCAVVCRDPDDPASPGWWDVTSPTADPTADNEAAMWVCGDCQVRQECLTDAHHRHDAHAIRGGMMPSGWRPIRRREDDAA